MLKMAELIWECLIISTVLLFGINIALAMGLNQIPKNKLLSIALLYGAILFTLGSIAGYVTSLYNFTNEYIAFIIGIIGVVTIVTGSYTIIKWKKDRNDHDTLLSKATISASICCFAGFTFSAILLAKGMDSFYLVFNIIMAIAVILILIVLYQFSKFLRHAERPYPVILGNFMILNGFYFLIAGLFLPNIKSLALVQTNPLSIGSTTNLIFLITAAVGVFLVGVYLKKEGINNLSDIYPGKSSKIERIKK
jgi:predicted transporter